jgi:hypothetical protein
MKIKYKQYINILAIFAFFLWWGGFTFYASFVIPTGQRILGSHVLMGFISQAVTKQINYAALITCLLLILNEFFRSDWSIKRIKSFSKICLISMLTIVIFLFCFHPYLDALLDFQNRTIIDEPYFYFLHRIYLLLSSVLWFIGIIYMVNLLKK